MIFEIMSWKRLPLETRALALQPSEPIQENCPVAFFLFTAFISSATSWSDPNTITPERVSGWNFRFGLKEEQIQCEKKR